MPEPLLSDAEVIATWMEAKPEAREGDGAHYWSPGEWWELLPNAEDWTPVAADLNMCHLVEARPIAEDRGPEINLAYAAVSMRESPHIWKWNLRPEQKIRALAAVLRPLRALERVSGGVDE